METIRTTRQLLESGYDKGELRRLRRAGELSQLRRGVWAQASADQDASRELRHRKLVAAVVTKVSPDAVVSHVSAAVVVGLPVWSNRLDRVHLTRSRSNGAKRRPDLELHSATLPAGQVTYLDGLAITSLARTVADLGRVLPFEQAVAAGDRAVALGLDFGDLEEVLHGMERWPGVAQARRVADFLDGRSESVGESVSRVRIAEEGLPGPTPQRKIYDHTGRFIARVDFYWEQFRTVGEFDGKIKYGDLLKPGQRPGDVLFEEKLREDAVRDSDRPVVRWTWDDLYTKGVLRDRLLRAFARRR